MINKIYIILFFLIFNGCYATTTTFTDDDIEKMFYGSEYIIKAKINSGKLHDNNFIYTVTIIEAFNDKSVKLKNANINISIISDYSLKIGTDYLMFLHSISSNTNIKIKENCLYLTDSHFFNRNLEYKYIGNIDKTIVLIINSASVFRLPIERYEVILEECTLVDDNLNCVEIITAQGFEEQNFMRKMKLLSSF